MDQVEFLRQQGDRVAKIVENVTPDQYGMSSPCKELDAKGVINHMIGANLMMAGLASGAAAPFDGDSDHAGQDPAGAFRRSVQTAADAFAAPDVLDKIMSFGPLGDIPGAVALGILTTEVVVHGWDLAKATGQDTSIPDEVALALLPGAQMIPDEFRNEQGNPFGLKVDPGASAPPGAQLVGLLGRKA